MRSLEGDDHRSRLRRILAGVLTGTIIIGSIVVPNSVKASEAASWNIDSVQVANEQNNTAIVSGTEEKSREELEEELYAQREQMDSVHNNMSTITLDQDPMSISVLSEDGEAQRANVQADAARLDQLLVQSNQLGQNNIGGISKCEIVPMNGSYQVCVTASVPESVGTVYLIELKPYEYTLDGKVPVAQAAAASTVTMQTDLGNIQEASYKLFSKFVLAVKNADSSYSAITAPKYITNTEIVAANTFAFPQTASKKGLQANATMVEDSVELGIKHAAVNFCVDEMISLNGGIAYTYKGKTYYFNEAYIYAYDALLRRYYENNIQVSFIILLRKNANSEGLLYEAALDTGSYHPNCYALDTSNQNDAEWVEAIMTFLGSRYTRTDGQYGQIVNWILGNELNTPMYYNWMGAVSLDTYVNELTRTYRIFHNALKSCYSNVRTYLSFDYCWGSIPNNPHIAFSTREILDIFDDKIETEGDVNWNIAYHAYPFMLKDPTFWNNEPSLVNDSEDSRIVNMKNIQVLTNYVEKNFGRDTRIILSEQGFSAEPEDSEKSQMTQAAAYAYAYYISESHDMIDAFIIRAHVDNRIETNEGFYFGLWTNKDGYIEQADKKRKIWDVVKYIDTPATLDYTNPLLTWIDCVNVWNNIAPRLENFDIKKFNVPDDSIEGNIPNDSIEIPDNSDNELPIVETALISYSAHVQNKGWMPYVESGEKAGTTGLGLRMESLRIKLDTNLQGGLSYAAHVQNKGWMKPVTEGKVCGTTGKGLRVEACWIRLTGELAEKYDIYYRTHIQNYGWLGWASNGAYSGSSGMSLRMEALQIQLVKKGETAPSSTKEAYVKRK